MFKKIFAAVFALPLFCISHLYANIPCVIDTPTPGTLGRGVIVASLRIFSHGNMTPAPVIGILGCFDLGLSWEVDKLIGNGKIRCAVPAPLVKFSLYGGSIALPKFALGYDGQGFFVDKAHHGKYLQKGRGFYLVTGRELFIEGLMLNLGVNINDFSKVKFYWFANATIPLYPDVVSFMLEYDHANNFSNGRINFGLRFSLTEYLDVDFIIRDFRLKKDRARVSNERVLRISYIGKF
jgi:hypothetical protein